MSYFRALIGGLVGGAVGAGVWVGVGQFTGYEIGYIAILVGFLSGWFAQKACVGHYIGLPHGLIASTCAVLAIVGAKYSLVSHAITEAKTSIEAAEPERDELIACVADSLLGEINEKGQAVSAPVGETEVAIDDLDEEGRIGEREYPPVIIKVATEHWDELLDEERHAYVSKARNMRAAAMGFGPALLSGDVQQVTNAEFTNSFGIYDILWFALAVGAAFKFGSADPDDEDIDDEADDEDDDDEVDED